MTPSRGFATDRQRRHLTSERERIQHEHEDLAIVNYTEYRGEMKRFVGMAQWREFSGLDRHTLFADPLYRDSAARDFRLDAKSPNRGAGADGATIGAPGD